MALTKLPKNAFGTGSVDSDKIEDGTIQNVELSGSLANDRLVNSTITFNGTSTALGGSVSVTPFVEWQSVITADGSTTTTGVVGNGYFIDTTSNSHTFNLPASASTGDTIAIKDYAGTFGSNNLTIGRNGHNIQGVANDSLISTNRASLVLVYVDSTKGWLFTDEHNLADLQEPFIAATGGTVTTSGDYKIHTFTGDGCFVVSQISPATAPDIKRSVDYLVVGGGGSGSARPGNDQPSGGGAGGFRYSNLTFPVTGAPGAPLANPTGITVSATTYPITVGGGGAPVSGSCIAGNDGSNSVFSTITSAGGGRGGKVGGCTGTPNAGGSGGSGGGNGGGPNFSPNAIPAPSGNTPPVSPPQGNNGGSTPGPHSPNGPASGAGGALTAGGNAPGDNTAATSGSGAGVPDAFGTSGESSGGFYHFSGGGAVGGTTSAGAAGTGGIGGGADGSGNAGTANTGGGGSGADGGAGPNPPSGAGGKGIVIIRYKFQ